MSPMISVTKEREDLKDLEKKFKNQKNQLLKIRKYIEKNFEFVGEKF